MNLNATLLAEMVAFFLFVVITMKWIWPMLGNALAEREQKIADGLAAGERGKQELAKAHDEAGVILKDARGKAADAVNTANQQASQILETARKESQAERQRQVEAAKAEIQQELNRAKDALRAEVAKVALAAAERIIEREIDAKAHKALLDELASQIH
ncbi:MAG TPA: F0F1 ATP synthase subunit B [Gammaproteobacteria bacterium]|nr:F0F1 ATP synthase subunit B [Gammaproteobacteria bacterium]